MAPRQPPKIGIERDLKAAIKAVRRERGFVPGHMLIPGDPESVIDDMQLSGELRHPGADADAAEGDDEPDYIVPREDITIPIAVLIRVDVPVTQVAELVERGGEFVTDAERKAMLRPDYPLSQLALDAEEGLRGVLQEFLTLENLGLGKIAPGGTATIIATEYADLFIGIDEVEKGEE